MKTSIEIEDSLWKRAKVHCVMQGIDLKDLIAIALDRYLDMAEDEGITTKTTAKEVKKKK